MGVALSPLVRRPCSAGSGGRAVAAAAIVGGGMVLFFAGVVLLVAPPAVDQARDFSDELPATVRELYSWPIIGARLEEADAAGQVEETIEELPGPHRRRDHRRRGRAAARRGPVDGGRRGHRDRCARRRRADRRAGSAPSCPPRGSAHADHVGQIVYHSFGSYFAGSLLVAVLNGLVILTAGLTLGVPLAPVAALWATLTNFIPQIGGFLGGSFFVLLALTQSPATALIAAGDLPRLPAAREQRHRPRHRRRRGEPHPAHDHAGRAGRRGGGGGARRAGGHASPRRAKALYLDGRGELPPPEDALLKRRSKARLERIREGRRRHGPHQGADHRTGFGCERQLDPHGRALARRARR